MPLSGFSRFAVGFNQMIGMSVYNSFGRDSVSSCWSKSHRAPSRKRPRMKQPLLGREVRSASVFFITFRKQCYVNFEYNLPNKNKTNKQEKKGNSTTVLKICYLKVKRDNIDGYRRGSRKVLKCSGQKSLREEET